MTDTEKKEAYLEWIKDYCNNDFLDDEGVEVIPATVNLAIEKMLEADKIPAGVSSEKQGGKSVSFSENRYKDIKPMLSPYKKVRW